MKLTIILFLSATLSFAQSNLYRPFKVDIMIGKGDFLFNSININNGFRGNSLNNSGVLSVEPKYYITDNVSAIYKGEIFVSNLNFVLSSTVGLELYFSQSNVRPFVSISAGRCNPSLGFQRPVISPRGGIEFGRFRIAAELNFIIDYSYYTLKTGFVFGGGRKKARVEEPRIPKQRVIEPVLVAGRVLNEKTNEPVRAKIVYFIQSENRNIDSTLSNSKSGEYRFNLKPSLYQYVATADGYESFSDITDLTAITTKGQYVQNIFLKPIEHQNSTDAIKIDENKFRLDKVYFELGSPNLLQSSHPQLDGLVKMMQDNLSMKIQVEGHTNRIGDEDENIKLSLNRASNVRKYLTDRGIKENRIKIKGYGSSMPIVPEDSEENRAKNRRVEFVVF